MKKIKYNTIYYLKPNQKLLPVKWEPNTKVIVEFQHVNNKVVRVYCVENPKIRSYCGTDEFFKIYSETIHAL